MSSIAVSSAPVSNIIHLSDDDLQYADFIADERDVESHFMGLSHAAGLTDEAARKNKVSRNGARAEQAFRRWLKCEAPLTVNTFKSIGDVAGYEVRTCDRPGYKLIIRPSDNNYRIYVLVAPIDKRFESFAMKGWMSAIQAKSNPDWVYSDNGRPACWMVPQSHLWPMKDLPEGMTE